jgi:hypothetical protein
MAENQERIVSDDAGSGPKSDERILKASARNFVPVHGRAAHQLRTLPLVQENIPELQCVNRSFFGLEIHPENVGRVDPVLEYIGHPEIGPHVRSMLLPRRYR